MQVQAIKKGNKEQILVDGEVFLKSATAGKWNYIVKISYTDENGERKEMLGKSETKGNAANWQPTVLGRPFIGKVPAEYKDRAVETPSKAYRKYFVVPYTNITREIVEIER